MSQTHIFNFFSGSIHSNRILKTLSLFASRQKNCYSPNQQVWSNKVYFQISNSKEKKCLTKDTRDVNELGPGKFRTSADNGEEKTCYFNRDKSDTHFTCFSAKWTQAEPITFSIVKLNSDFELVNKSLEFELKNSVSNGQLKRQLQQVSSEDFNNGKWNRPKIAEPNDVPQQQYGGRRGDSRRREQTTAIGRKKPIYLSAADTS